MGWLIHRRDPPEGPRYRIWSTVVDAYITEPMTRAEVSAFLLDDYVRRAKEEIEERLSRTDTYMTSSRVIARNAGGPWEAERCIECGEWGEHECPVESDP